MFVIGSSRSSNTNTGYNVGKNPNKTIADPIKSMFDMLLKIKQGNPYLVGRILELFEINLGIKTDSNLQGGGEGSILENSTRINNNQVAAADRAFFQMNNDVSPQVHSLKLQQVMSMIHITPQSLPLIYNLLSYLTHCKTFITDSSNRLLDILVKLLRLYLAHLGGVSKTLRLFSFTRGFPDSERAEQSFSVRFLAGVEGVLGNKYLPIRYHALLTEIMGSENIGIAEIIGKIVDGTILVGAGQSDEWSAIVKMAKVFTPRQTEETIAKLRAKYQAPSSLREGLSKDPNKRVIILIIRMLILNQNGIALAQLRSHNLLNDLQTICLHQINKYLKSRSPNANPDAFQLHPVNFNELENGLRVPLSTIEPYFSLLLQLLITSQHQQQQHYSSDSPRILGEFLAYFYRTAIDKPVSTLNKEDTRLSLQLVVKAIQEQGLFNKNKEELLEIMEVLSLFTWNFQRQNTILSDMLNSGNANRIMAEQSTRISMSIGGAGGNHSQQASNIPQMIMLNRNLIDLQLAEVFEEGILNLVSLESELDTSFQETSASIKYLNSLIRYLQSLRKNDETIGSCIFFKLKLIETLVKNYGSQNEQVKSALQTLTHKLVKSFDYILVSNEGAHISDILRILFKVVIKDLAREDLTIFLMQELQKVFKKSSYNTLMCESFYELAQLPLSKKDVNKTNVHIFHTQISIINQLWHDQQIDDLSNESFSILLKALALSLEKSDLVKAHHSSVKGSGHSSHSSKIFQHFIQMWIVIFSYLTEHENSKFDFRPQLIKLASLTPYLVYIQEFSLMLRIGHNKDVLERFIQVSFQKFPGLTSGAVAGTIQNVPLTSQQKEERHIKNTQNQTKQTQNAIEIADDDEEGEDESEMGFGERLFLSIFAQIQEYRMHSLSSVQERLPLLPSHPNNFVESLLTVFVNEKIDSDAFINKVDKLTADLFDIYLANLKDVEQDTLKEQIQIQDFTFLLKSSCHLQKRLSSKSKYFLQSYIYNYPFLLLKPKVLATLLDILDAINREMYHAYDSLSHAIRLPTTGEQIFLQTRQEAKHEIMQDLANLCQDMFVYASIISTEELNRTFEGYQCQTDALGLHNHLSQQDDSVTSHEKHYGISFFEYLRSNLDLSKVDLAQSSISSDSLLPLNFHSLRNLAFAKPWKFVKVIEEMKKQTPNGLFSAPNHVFNLTKKSQQSQIERTINLKPFQTPQINGASAVYKCDLYRIEVEARLKQSSVYELYQELEGKIRKQIMQVDMYHAVKQMLKYNTKEEVYAILKQITSQRQNEGQKKMHIKSMIYNKHQQQSQKVLSSLTSPNTIGNSLIINRGGGIPENVLYHGMPFILNDNQKLGKTLQKLVHQVNRKQFINDLQTKLELTIGLLVQQLIKLEDSKRTSSLHPLSLQILYLIASFPATSLTPQAFTAYTQAFSMLQCQPKLQDHLLTLLPLSLKVAGSKVQKNASRYDQDQIIKAFEIVNHFKNDMAEINEDCGVIKMIESLMNDQVAQYDTETSFFLTTKLNSNWMQEHNAKAVIQYLNLVLYQIQQVIFSKALTTDTSKIEALAKVYLDLLTNYSKILFDLRSTKGFTKLSLTIIKTGFILMDSQKLCWKNKSGETLKKSIAMSIAQLHTVTIEFMMKYLRFEMLQVHTNHNLEFKELIQLIQDCNYLIESQSDHQSLELQQLIQKAHNQILTQSKDIYATKNASKSLHVYRNSKGQLPHKRSLMQPLDRSLFKIDNGQRRAYQLEALISKDVNGEPGDFKTEVMIALYLLTYQKQTILSWNYNEKMKDIKNIPHSTLEPSQFQERVKGLIQRYPKLAIYLSSKIGTNPKILEILKPALSQDIAMRPNVYQYSTDALEIYLDQLYAEGKLKASLQQIKPVIAEWRCWNFVRLFKYLGFKYNGEYFLNQLALKPLEFVKSKTILQYLPQMFQSLRNDCQNQIQYFLVKKCKEFASVAHNVLWYCKVEEEEDKTKGRKVPLPLRENLHEVTVVLRANILRHMTQEALQFFDTETEFFERITSISGELLPKMSKDEKKARIAQRLVEYNKSIPDSVYLPTNTNCRVVGIVTTSGMPMQSAARVPILISFEVEDYPGPDNDPVLMQGLAQSHALQSTMPSNNMSGINQPVSNQNLAIGNIASSFQEFKLGQIGRQGSSVSQGSKKLTAKKSLRKKNSARRHQDKNQDLLNNEGSIVVDEDSNIPIRSDDEESNEDVFSKVADNQIAAGAQIPPNHYSDFDSEDENAQNVSPRSTPASQIAILNIKSRLQNYNFVANRNESKFSGTFVNTIAQLQEGHRNLSYSVVNQPGFNSLGTQSHRLQSTPIFVDSQAVQQQYDNSSVALNEEQKVNKVPQIQINTTTQLQYSDKKQIIVQQQLSSTQDRMLASIKTNLNHNNGAQKTSVSEIEQRRAIYHPILDLQQSRRKKLMHTPKALNIRGKRKSVMIRDQYVSGNINAGSNTLAEFSPSNKQLTNPQLMTQNVRIVSCIFKVNDDLRQDIIALQVIKLFQKIFKKNDLDLFVAPYKCISNRTGGDRTLGGIIECVPNSHSRDQLGKAFEIDLYQYFLKKFGIEQSAEFKLARLNFIKSLSSYSVVSYILQIKDRHNGNIMIDDYGHIIHIDFGFIFDWSPGKDMRFESADFKLTKEFIDILGGNMNAEAYQLFVTKTVQAYLSIREHYKEFRNLIQLMYYSGFPCFKEQSLQKLEERFRLDLNVLEAANHMRNLINNAHDKWSTKFYDRIQYLQNKIVF